MERWLNKIAVVTGASSGIGAACVQALVANGMIVVGLARRHERMETELKASLPKDQQSRFHAIKCDVSNEADILSAFAWVEQHLGGVAVLVNNAGIVRQTQIVEAKNTADLKAVLDTNVLGVALCTREAYQSMKKHSIDDGHVLIINSIAGHGVPQVPGTSLNIYPPSKHAITALTEVLRQEFRLNETKIKVTSISPGAVDTEILGNIKNLGEIPLLAAADIASAVVYSIQTPPNVQIHEMIIKPVGETF